MTGTMTKERATELILHWVKHIHDKGEQIGNLNMALVDIAFRPVPMPVHPAEHKYTQREGKAMGRPNYFALQCYRKHWPCDKPACKDQEACRYVAQYFVPDRLPYCIVTMYRYGGCPRHDYRTKQCKVCRAMREGSTP